MSKERPFKSFKTPAERPFKTYNPVPSVLFQDPQQEQPLRLGLLNGLIQQQQQQQTQQQQHQQPPPPPPPQQQMSYSSQLGALQPAGSQQRVYGDPDDFLHLTPQQRRQQQDAMLGIDTTLNSYYEDLELEDPDNPMIRQDLMAVTNESILQREQDLNIGQASSAMAGIHQNFIIPNRHNPRVPSGLPPAMSATPQDTLSMLFDQTQSAMNQFPVALQQQVHHHQQQLLNKSSNDRNLVDNGSNGSHFLSAISSASQGLLGSGGAGQNSNGRTGAGDILSSQSMVNVDHFPIKREADEGHSHLDESRSPSSTQSPTQSDSVGESPQRNNLKRSVSNSSGCSNSNQDNHCHNDSGRMSDGNGSELDSKDPAYLEKRRKNNESAKRSREARRNKEELVAIRVITLEEENMKLRAEISLLDKELDELRARLFT